MKYLIAAFLTCFAFIPQVSAQKDDKKLKTIDVKFNLSVRDAAGAGITDPKKEDLKLFENNKEQAVTGLDLREQKINLGIVADNTGSMRSQLETVIGLGKQMIAGMSDSDEVFIERFVASDNIKLASDWSSNKRMLNAGLDQLYVEGGQSAVIDAIYAAANKMAQRAKDNPSQRFAIALISDCEDRSSYYKEAALFEKLRETGVQIFVFALTDELGRETGFTSKAPRERSESFAYRLALATGGAVYYPFSKKGDPASSAQSLFTELRSQYVVSYASTNTDQNGKKRDLRIEVAPGAKGETRTAIMRDGFVVPQKSDK